MVRRKCPALHCIAYDHQDGMKRSDVESLWMPYAGIIRMVLHFHSGVNS